MPNPAHGVKPTAPKPKVPRNPVRPATPGHRLVTKKALVNGVVETTYSCPCGGFHQSAREPGSTRPVPRHEVRARYERHLSL